MKMNMPLKCVTRMCWMATPIYLTRQLFCIQELTDPTYLRNTALVHYMFLAVFLTYLPSAI
jgi:hypothetical protein